VNYISILESSILDVKDLLNCYDDANLLFSKELRAPGTEKIIEDILKGNQVYHLEISGEIIGWIAWSTEKSLSHLNALYVLRTYHGKKVSDYLMNFYYQKCIEGEIDYSVLSYLNQAVWAKKYYEKQCYQTIEPQHSIFKDYFELHQRSYSSVMYKEIK